uniref:FeoB-associated Cys-rich membrane protein n=1 Tax=Nitratidesulfovibrio vulgaris (strain DSM 19637 / Miyazaki F) TaxID=883 RepID=B8DPR5_NITV9
MTWDTLLVVAIVVAAAGYVARRYLFRKSGGCGCGCDCSASSGSSGGSGCCGGGGHIASKPGTSCGCGK